MEIMQFKFVYLAYSESLSREKFFCGRTKYEKDAFRLVSRDDSLETLLMYMPRTEGLSDAVQVK